MVSAASLLPLGAPGYLLSQGAIVSIFGSNLSTSVTGVGATFVNGALPTSLGGASVTIGGVAAPLFYVSAGQINAQIPFTVSTGTAVAVVVTTAAGASAPSTIPVGVAAPALFSASQNGLGNAAAQNYVTATNTPANGFNSAIPQGNILIAYGTGGGALTTPPANGAPCAGGTFVKSYSATIGGLAASVQYAGCSPGFVGLDQWNIQVPAGVPTGCYLPLQVVVNGVASNAVTISVAPASSNGNCSTGATTGQAQVGSGQASGSLNIERLTIAIPGFNEVGSQFTGTFARNGAVATSSQGGFPPANAGCYVQVSRVSSTTTPAAPTVTGTTPLDAGILTLVTPSGSITLPPTPTGTVGSYSASSLIPTPPVMPTIAPGKFTVSGAGGKDVGSFSASFTLPALMNVTNPGYTGTSISESQSLNPTLTCPDPQGEIIAWIIATNSNNIQGTAICTFSCAASGSTSFSVPSSVLQQLPTNSGNTSVFYFFLAPSNNDQVSTANFTATGLNLGLLYYSDIYLVSSLSLTP